MIHVIGDSIAFGHELADTPHDSVLNGKLQTSSKFAWPALIGAKNWSNPGCSNGFIIRTMSILCTALKRENVDTIIVQWTFPERTELPALFAEDQISTTGHWIQGRKTHLSIKVWLDSFMGVDFIPKNKQEHDYIQWIDNYYKMIYTNDVGLLKLLENILWSQHMLSNLNIQYYMLLPTKDIIKGLFDRTFGDLGSNVKKGMAPMGTNYNDDIIHIRDVIDWNKFICYNNREPFYSILDRARENNDLGREGHPLEDTHKEFADELRRRIL